MFDTGTLFATIVADHDTTIATASTTTTIPAGARIYVVTNEATRPIRSTSPFRDDLFDAVGMLRGPGPSAREAMLLRDDVADMLASVDKRQRRWGSTAALEKGTHFPLDLVELPPVLGRHVRGRPRSAPWLVHAQGGPRERKPRRRRIRVWERTSKGDA